MTKKIINILLVIIWMIIIFSFSNQPATESSKLSNSVIRNTISKIIKNDSDEVLEKYTRPVRKLAHFSIYLVLGFLVLNCFKISKRNIIYSVLICFLYSISDEIHQMFIDGRSSEIFDVLIDTIGSSFGVFINYTLKRKISKK